MATIYYTRDSIIQRDNDIENYHSSNHTLEKAQTLVEELNDARTEEDLEIGIKYYFLKEDLTHDQFYDVESLYDYEDTEDYQKMLDEQFDIICDLANEQQYLM